MGYETLAVHGDYPGRKGTHLLRLTMIPRPYQVAAIDAVYRHICEHDTNPCVVLPTGAGKSNLMAWLIQYCMADCPTFRVIVLAHVKELVRQNAEKMRLVWPEANIGIFSAGLKSRDMHQNIIFAGIQSVYDKACSFDPFDLILIDEAHRVPVRGDGTYRQFIREARLSNPSAVVVGVTATPWRLGAGPICHRDHVLHKIVYSANVKELIDDGYLCPLRSKVGDNQPDTSGVKRSRGDFVESQLAQVVNAEGIVEAAVAEIVPLIQDRKGILFFCVNIDHAHRVSAELAKYGIHAPTLTEQTGHAERDRLTAGFVSGEIRALCNIRVLCEGFDATRTDCIVLLRPTQSAGLFQQMCGRGLRLDPRKKDCLILCLSGNLERHGPLDLMNAGDVKLIHCPECKEYFSRAVGACPGCGWPVPPEPMPMKPCPECETLNFIAAEICTHCGEPFDLPGKEKLKPKPSTAPVISDTEYLKPWNITVERVSVERHQRKNDPTALPTLQVTYAGYPESSDGGNLAKFERHKEWICLEHHGYAGDKARAWWRSRFGEPVPATVDEALSANLFLEDGIKDKTESIRVRRSGRYTEIVSCTLTGNQLSAVSH